MLVDFILECIIPGEDEPNIEPEVEHVERWVLHVDGSSNVVGFGVRLILTSLEVVVEYAMCFKFSSQITKLDMKPLLLGLRLPKSLEYGI